MSSQYLINEQTLTNIADAIRNKSGETGAILAREFAAKISELQISAEGGTELVTTQFAIANKSDYKIVIQYVDLVSGALQVATKTMAPSSSAQINCVVDSFAIILGFDINVGFAITTSSGVFKYGLDALGNAYMVGINSSSPISCEIQVAQVADAVADDVAEGKLCVGQSGVTQGTLKDSRNGQVLQFFPHDTTTFYESEEIVDYIESETEVDGEQIEGSVIVGPGSQIHRSFYDVSRAMELYATGHLDEDGTIWLEGWYTPDGYYAPQCAYDTHYIWGYVEVDGGTYCLPFASGMNDAGYFAYVADSSGRLSAFGIQPFTISDVGGYLNFDPTGYMLAEGYTDVTVYAQVVLGGNL